MSYVSPASGPRCAAVLALACALCVSAARAADTPPAKAKAAASAPAGGSTGTRPVAKPTEAAPREGAFGKGTSTLPILTKDQLRQCVAEQDRMKKEGNDLAQAQAKMEKDRAEIERLGAELEADKAKVDTTDEAAVNAYNDRARQRTKMIEEFKGGAPAFNARVDKLVVDRQAYAAACADRRFFEEDYEAIKAGK